jgi:hypothetical protein
MKVMTILMNEDSKGEGKTVTYHYEFRSNFQPQYNTQQVLRDFKFSSSVLGYISIGK